MVAVADDPTETAARLAAAQRDNPDAALAVHTVPGGTDARLAAALRAAGATRFPLFGYLDAGAAAAPPAEATLAALGVGKPSDLLLILAPTILADQLSSDPAATGLGAYRLALHDAGFPLVTVVELVTDGELLVFATTSGKSLEGLKEALWAAAEDAGIRLRDPGDLRRQPIEVSAAPDLDPLHDVVLSRLRAEPRCSVTDLRTVALTDTVYRAADANRVVAELLSAGAVLRTPEHGRLGGDVMISLAEPAGRT